jgi:hypothetical protein
MQQSLSSNVDVSLLSTIELPSQTFDFHTHGLGSKLMHMTGYIGGGLGNNG